MKLIIPENERSKEPLDTDRVIYHPDMIRANEWVLTEYEAPYRELCIFVPQPKGNPIMKALLIKIRQGDLRDCKPDDVYSNLRNLRGYAEGT